LNTHLHLFPLLFFLSSAKAFAEESIAEESIWAPRQCSGQDLCVFPFKYQGATYETCTHVGDNGGIDLDVDWCAIETDASGNYIAGRWGECQPCTPGRNYSQDIVFKYVTSSQKWADTIETVSFRTKTDGEWSGYSTLFSGASNASSGTVLVSNFGKTFPSDVELSISGTDAWAFYELTMETKSGDKSCVIRKDPNGLAGTPYPLTLDPHGMGYWLDADEMAMAPSSLELPACFQDNAGTINTTKGLLALWSAGVATAANAEDDGDTAFDEAMSTAVVVSALAPFRTTAVSSAVANGTDYDHDGDDSHFMLLVLSHESGDGDDGDGDDGDDSGDSDDGDDGDDGDDSDDGDDGIDGDDGDDSDAAAAALAGVVSPPWLVANDGDDGADGDGDGDDVTSADVVGSGTLISSLPASEQAILDSMPPAQEAAFINAPPSVQMEAAGFSVSPAQVPGGWLTLPAAPASSVAAALSLDKKSLISSLPASEQAILDAMPPAQEAAFINAPPVVQMEAAGFSVSDAPTAALTDAPTAAPTDAPTDAPTAEPTDAPTAAPTDAPTDASTDAPTAASTDAPTAASTDAPTAASTDAPTAASTDAPTAASTDTPTAASTDTPTAASTDAPTAAAQASVASGTPSATPTPLVHHVEIAPDEVKLHLAKHQTLHLTELQKRIDDLHTAAATQATATPTDAPTDAPTAAPTDGTTNAPTATQASAASGTPSATPTPLVHHVEIAPDAVKLHLAKHQTLHLTELQKRIDDLHTAGANSPVLREQQVGAPEQSPSAAKFYSGTQVGIMATVAAGVLVVALLAARHLRLRRLGRSTSPSVVQLSTTITPDGSSSAL
jgi:hypothetical protein